MPIFHLDFQLGTEAWTNTVRANSYKVLKREIDTYFPKHTFKKIDFIPQKENTDLGIYTIVEDLEPIGTVNISQL